MKRLLLIGLIGLTGCSGFNCSIGVGYRKIPPEVKEPILKASIPESIEGLTPAQIISMLELIDWKYIAPDDNRVDVGGWCEISIGE